MIKTISKSSMIMTLSRFKLAVLLAVMAALFGSYAAAANIEGLETSKKVTSNGNNTFTITMETYTTGKIEGGDPMPADIWILMDQSSSMEKNFSGGSSGTTKQAALKTAVTNFIDQVAAKYSSKLDYRIALCTFFGNNKTTPKVNNVIGGDWWHYVTPSEASTMKSKINAMSLKTNQATYINEGMNTTKLNTVNSSTGQIDTDYSGSNTKRSTVVVVFTDGCPSGDGNSGAFNMTIANEAFNRGVFGEVALAMKKAGITIFTVGIQSGADPNQYDLTIGSSPSTSESNAGPLCNRFLNYLSSNFTADDAPDMGITSGKVTANYKRTNSDYYLTANNAEDLKKIFETISKRIVVPTISLDAKTVMKDKVSPYFSLPSNTSAINFYTATYNGSSFASRVAASGLTASISGDVLTVKGFDFDANCCTKDAKPDGTHGKKVIVEFTVTPKNGFLGGNVVPTNVESESGVISEEKGMLENYTAQYPGGKGGVDVNIADLKLRVPEANVYENGDYGPSVANTLEISSDGGSTYKRFDTWVAGLADWQKAYVKDATPAFSNGKVTIEIDPTFTGSVTKKTISAAVNLNIFKPVLTFTDKTVKANTSINTSYYNTNNYKSSKTVWKCGSTASTSVTMIGSATTIGLSYSPASFTASVKGGDQNVVVTVTTNGKASGATFVWEKDTQCSSGETAPQNAQFRIHCLPGLADLIITKIVQNSTKSNDHFIFTVTGPDNYRARVMVAPNSNVTIKNLPIGDYTVQEETAWSWAYTASDPASAKLTKNIGTNNVFEFKNTPKTVVPPHAEAYKNNKMKKNN